MADPSLLRFRLVIEAALAQLESRREEVNDLNVFPVADGDTGDNMALTLRAVLHELDDLSTQGEIDEIGREQIVDSVARAALLGARGNSGVILSQLIRGAAEELISRPGELVDPVLVAAAMARAADRAYGSVRDPAEGTILTVVREMAARVASEIAHMDEPRLQHRVDDATQNEMLAYVLEHALDAGQSSVKRGPELLPILRDAGVVDAGGYGLTVIFAGVIAALRGADPPPLEHHAPARITHPQHASSTYRYCTNFAVTGEGLEPVAVDRAAGAPGRLGARRRRRPHAEGPRPHRRARARDRPLRGRRHGLARRRRRHARAGRAAHRAPPRRRSRAAACSPWSPATACASCSRAWARTCSTAAPTLNPSTYELLAGIHEVPAEEVVVLPNSPNVRMAAERAAELSEKTVSVLPTRSMASGLAAVVVLDPAGDARGQRRRDGGGADPRPHRRRHRGRARRHPGPLPPRRLGRLHRRGARGLGRAERDARGRARRARPRGRAADRDRGRRRAAAAATPWPRWRRTSAEVELERGGQPAWWWLVSAE